ncbi:MAG: YceI family protein, partial [Betaproteobacteria bacterium]
MCKSASMFGTCAGIIPAWVGSSRVTSWLVAAALVLASGQANAADATYALDEGKSSVVVHVGKAGLFSFAGHEHVVSAPRLHGEVLAAADDLSRSRVTLSFETAALRVEEKGEPAGDAPKVQEVMVGPRVLDVSRFPKVTFTSKAVTGRSTAQGAYDLEITGDLSLHGVTR